MWGGVDPFCISEKLDLGMNKIAVKANVEWFSE